MTATTSPAEIDHRPHDVVNGLLWWVPGCLIFFRYAFRTGFDKIMGNDGDARLQVFGHEHWVQVFRGQVSWTSPNFYYPVKGVLGYSDTFLLNEVFYLPLRAAGLDEFLAFQWTLILMSLVGFVALFVLLRQTLALSAPICAALATAFAFANNMYIKAGHLQLYSVYWLPVLLLLLLHAYRADRRGPRLAWGLAAGAFLGLLFYSTYYIAWFAVLASLIFSLVIAIWRVRAIGWRECVGWLRQRLAIVVGFGVGFAVAMIPFVITYLPALRSSGGRTYDDAMLFAAKPADVFNVSGTNYLWGSAMRGTLSAARLANGEVSLALTPILLLATLASAAVVLVVRRTSAAGLTGAVCVASVTTVVGLVLMPVKFGWGSLWRIPWTVVPGAVGIRAIDRVMMVAGLFAVIAIGCALRVLNGRQVDSPRSSRIRAVVVATLLILIVVEQLNVANSSLVDRSDQLKALIVAPEPPAECNSFFIVDSAATPVPFFVSGIDAMLISQHFRIPTLNGYSGQVPDGFDLLDAGAAGYVDRVHAWAAANNVTSGLCSYDRTAHLWAGPV